MWQIIAVCVGSLATLITALASINKGRRTVQAGCMGLVLRNGQPRLKPGANRECPRPSDYLTVAPGELAWWLIPFIDRLESTPDIHRLTDDVTISAFNSEGGVMLVRARLDYRLSILGVVTDISRSYEATFNALVTGHFQHVVTRVVREFAPTAPVEDVRRAIERAVDACQPLVALGVLKHAVMLSEITFAPSTQAAQAMMAHAEAVRDAGGASQLDAALAAAFAPAPPVPAPHVPTPAV